MNVMNDHCRCPGCGRCAASLNLEKVQAKLDAAYAELRKQRPAITAVFDRAVWDDAARQGAKK